MSGHIINRAILEQIISFHRSNYSFYQNIKTNCESCSYFKDSIGFCGKYEDMVPADVVAKGCDEWLYDDIPF